MTDRPFSGITIVGLGPGDPDLVTPQAWKWLASQKEVIIHTRTQPLIKMLPDGVVITQVDAADAAGQVLNLAGRPEGVTYAAAGSPLDSDEAAIEIFNQAQTSGIPVRVFPGLGFVEFAAALGLAPAHSILVDGKAFSERHVPASPATQPLLVSGLHNQALLERVVGTLLNIYPAQHGVKWIELNPDADKPVHTTDLDNLISVLAARPGGLLYVPPLEEGTSFEDFQEVIARLRAPDGCPWDREQTHLSLRRHLLEETYEALEALDMEDSAKMSEEFGDLLLQIVLHAQIASEAGEFTMLDIIRGIHHKIVRRHPHVFGEVQVGGVQGVLQNWEKLKAAERAANGEGTKGLLDGVPPALPALTQAQEIQERAARVGFDWPQIDGVLEKVGEEINELHQAQSEDELAWELGDLLFAVVNVARWKNVDAETALRDSSKRFRQRFAYIEHAAREQGRSVSELSFEEMDILWDAAKGKK